MARRGDTFPARVILPRRLSELEIHHVDLGAGYGPGDWPADFVQMTLARVTDDFAGLPGTACHPGPAGRPGCRVRARPGRRRASLPGPASPVTVTGPPAALLAWLIGRDNGAGLEVAGGAALPVLPPWR